MTNDDGWLAAFDEQTRGAPPLLPGGATAEWDGPRGAAVSVDDLSHLSEGCADLVDPDVMRRAWE